MSSGNSTNSYLLSTTRSQGRRLRSRRHKMAAHPRLLPPRPLQASGWGLPRMLRTLRGAPLPTPLHHHLLRCHSVREAPCAQRLGHPPFSTNCPEVQGLETRVSNSHQTLGEGQAPDLQRRWPPSRGPQSLTVRAATAASSCPSPWDAG